MLPLSAGLAGVAPVRGAVTRNTPPTRGWADSVRGTPLAARVLSTLVARVDAVAARFVTTLLAVVETMCG